MRWWVMSVVGLALVAGSGCRSCGIVESQLRAREIDVRELREELDRASIYNQALQNELSCLRGQPVPPGTPVVEKSIGVAPVRTLALGRQTGGRGDGTCSGDDCLQVQIEPRDPEGQAIKVAGSAIVQVFEINPEGVKRPLSSWEISSEQLRKSWRNGLLSTGYVLSLPWKVRPSLEKLRVVVQFRPIDGRLLEAEKDITVHLPTGPQRQLLTPAEPASVPLPFGPPIEVTPPAGPVLPEEAPPPRPVKPEPDANVAAPSAASGAPLVSRKPIAQSAPPKPSMAPSAPSSSTAPTPMPAPASAPTPTAAPIWRTVRPTPTAAILRPAPVR